MAEHEMNHRAEHANNRGRRAELGREEMQSVREKGRDGREERQSIREKGKQSIKTI